MLHDSSVLAEFQAGETRLVFARFRSGEPGLYLLPDGAANQKRTFTKTELLCPVEGCQTPELTTVNRADHGRDGFRHLRGNYKHGAESLFHLEGKAQIARWARTQCPDAQVVEEQKSNDHRDRIADVMVTFPSGERVAVEVQYAGLSPDSWQARHESYRAQGIVDVWLFGHSGNQLNVMGLGNEVRVNPTQQLVAKSGMPLLWFNPLTLQVAHTIAADRRHPSFGLPYFDHKGVIGTEPLERYTLTRSGISNPGRDKAVHDFLHYLAALDDEARRGRAKQAKLDAAARELREFNKNRRDLLRERWLAGAEAQTILNRFGGAWPAWLEVEVEQDIPIPRQMWQGVLFLKVIDKAAGGEWVRRDVAEQTLADEFGIVGVPLTAMVAAWYDALVSARILRMSPRRIRGRVARQHYKVLSEAEMEHRAEEHARWVQMERAKTERARGMQTQNVKPELGWPAIHRQMKAAARDELACKKCGGRLDPILAASGYHIGCAP